MATEVVQDTTREAMISNAEEILQWLNTLSMHVLLDDGTAGLMFDNAAPVLSSFR